MRQVLLQVLSDTEAIYIAFYTALAAATRSEEFATLAAEDGRGAGAVEVQEGVGEGGSGSEALSRAGQAPAQSMQRDLAALAKELERGLDVGVSAAMDRILQVRCCSCCSCCRLCRYTGVAVRMKVWSGS